MCGRYVLVQKVEILERRFNVTVPSDFDFQPSYNISPGKFAPVITCENPRELQLFQFGMSPFWAKKKMYLFNARAEGDRNKDNNPQFTGAKDIINKPAFRKPIRSQRCLVLADAFIEGTTNEGLSKSFLVYLQNKERPFAFAGIYDNWVDESTGEVCNSFAIITTVANELMQKIPHNRSPIILSKSAERRWLNPKAHLSEITNLLHPYPSHLMNAYPISDEIKNPKSDGRNLIIQKGLKLQPEIQIKTYKELKLEGMGNRNKNTIENRHPDIED